MPNVSVCNLLFFFEWIIHYVHIQYLWMDLKRVQGWRLSARNPWSTHALLELCQNTVSCMSPVNSCFHVFAQPSDFTQMSQILFFFSSPPVAAAVWVSDPLRTFKSFANAHTAWPSVGILFSSLFSDLPLSFLWRSNFLTYFHLSFFPGIFSPGFSTGFFFTSPLSCPPLCAP